MNQQSVLGGRHQNARKHAKRVHKENHTHGPATVLSQKIEVKEPPPIPGGKHGVATEPVYAEINQEGTQMGLCFKRSLAA